MLNLSWKMKMDKDHAYIESIYNQAMIKRSQDEKLRLLENQKDLDKQFWNTLTARMQNLLTGVMRLYDKPGVSKEDIDKAERSVGECFDMIKMYTMPEVIMQLTADLTKEKILNKLKNSIVV